MCSRQTRSRRQVKPIVPPKCRGVNAWCVNGRTFLQDLATIIQTECSNELMGWKDTLKGFIDMF
jgi:hypothetical protein